MKKILKAHMLSLHVCTTFAFLLAVWSPAECGEIGHRGRATSWKHVISIWLLLIEDVSAVEWVMTQEPSCSATDGLQSHTVCFHTRPHTSQASYRASYQLFAKDNMMSGKGKKLWWWIYGEKEIPIEATIRHIIYILIKCWRYICLLRCFYKNIFINLLEMYHCSMYHWTRLG